MGRTATAKTVINRAAVECGLTSATDPYSSTDENYIQFVELLNAAGQELLELHPWERLKKVHTFTTTSDDEYDLPDDYAYMLNQTGWDTTNDVALGGPLSSQDHAYLTGRDLAGQSIYISFRIFQGGLQVYPDPPPTGTSVRFEYISRNWVLDADASTRKDEAEAAADMVLYEPILIVKYLKVKWLEAKGLDSTAARRDLENMLMSRLHRDTGAPILSASRAGRAFPYLHPHYSVPDTGYGS